MEKCYSTNGEDFNFTELDDAVVDAFDDPQIPVGSTATVYEGDAVPWKAGDFVNFDVADLSQSAYDNAGEYADDWPNSTKEQDDDLEQRIAETVNKWADDHGLQPNFYQVKNVKEIKVKLLSESIDFEIIPD